MVTSNNTSSLPRIIRVNNPDRDAQFNAVARFAPSRKDLKSARNKLNVTCTRCLAREEAGAQLRRCGRCKGVWYCSKECQMQDWSRHKKTCKEVEGSGILKLINAFLANKVLMGYLKACLVFNFDLIRKPAIDAPFFARVDLGIEPSDITTCFNLYAGAEINSDKIEGMLQVNAVTPRRPNSTSVPLTPKSMEIWRRAREKADLEGFTSDSVGLLEFINNNPDNALTCAIHIQAPILYLVKKRSPFVTTSSMTGKCTEQPMSAMSCIEFINTHIRMDAHNRLLLRTDMRKEDIDIIRDARRGVDREAVHIFKDKMARESAYRVYCEE